MTAFVKICGLRERATIDVAVEAGASALGFVFWPRSVRYLDPAAAREACKGLGDDVLRVAVCLHPTRDEWQRIVDDFAPDVVQTDAADFEQLDVPVGIVRWPVLREGCGDPPATGTFVYEGGKSGAGEPVDWRMARAIGENRQMILAGGLAPDNIATAIDAAAPWGVDVSSGVESAPGQKDPDRIRAFIRAARAAARST